MTMALITLYGENHEIGRQRAKPLPLRFTRTPSPLPLTRERGAAAFRSCNTLSATQRLPLSRRTVGEGPEGEGQPAQRASYTPNATQSVAENTRRPEG